MTIALLLIGFTGSFWLAILTLFVMYLLLHWATNGFPLGNRRGNVNTYKQGIPQNTRWFPCPSEVTSGMAVLIGTMAAVAMDAYDSSTGGTTFWLDGSYFLSVAASSSQSPVSGLQVNPGDELYASGTYDTPTGITYSLTIDKTRGNCPFGNYEGITPILSGQTNANAPVRLKLGGSPGPYAS